MPGSKAYWRCPSTSANKKELSLTLCCCLNLILRPHLCARGQLLLRLWLRHCALRQIKIASLIPPRLQSYDACQRRCDWRRVIEVICKSFVKDGGATYMHCMRVCRRAEPVSIRRVNDKPVLTDELEATGFARGLFCCSTNQASVRRSANGNTNY